MKHFNVNVKHVLIFVCAICAISCNTEPDTGSEPLFNTVPEIKNCKAGSVSDREKEKVLTYINKIRTMHGLPSVKYSQTTSYDTQVQTVALIGAANGTSELSPLLQDAKCLTSSGYSAWTESIVSFWGSASANWPQSDIHIDDFIVEKGKEKANRRRAILDPFLNEISFGRVIGTPQRGDYKYVSVAALLVKHPARTDLPEMEMPEFIAFPKGVHDSRFYDRDLILSFSVLSDKLNPLRNIADFSGASVEVFSGTQSISVSNVEYDNDRYVGLPNNIQWKVDNLSRNVTYTVKIIDVEVEGERKNYEYTFSFK